MKCVRSIAALVLLTGLLVSAPGCLGAGAPPPNLTPAANKAWYAAKAQKALDEIRDIVQDGNATAPPVFSTTTTRRVTVWHESAITVLHAAGAGWQTAVTTSLDQLLLNVSPSEKATLAPYVALAKTVLQQVAP